MKTIIKEIFQEGESFFIGLLVFIILPFVVFLIKGEELKSLLLPFFITLIIYICLFLWVSRGGLRMWKAKRDLKEKLFKKHIERIERESKD